MDCTNARILLLFARPGCDEFADDERASLHDHLEQCTECRIVAHREKQLDDVLGRSMRQVPVPTGLQERIVGRLSRERPPRPWLKYAAAAAVLLLVMGLGLVAHAVRRPTLAAHDVEQALQVRPSPENLLAWFNEKGLKVEPPPELDFEYLDSWEVASLQGRRIPKLLFLNRGAVAHVYVVAADTFHVDDQVLQEELNANSMHAEVNRSGDFVFLVIYSAGSRDSFPRRGA